MAIELDGASDQTGEGKECKNLMTRTLDLVNTQQCRSYYSALHTKVYVTSLYSSHSVHAL